MAISSDKDPKAVGGHDREDFTATHWTEVALAAARDGSGEAKAALDRLCLRYWPAIYSFLRRRNFEPADAEDLAQGFFSHILEQNTIARADRELGRFRSFLLGALHRYLAVENRRQGAKKRGRGKIVAAMDFSGVEEAYLETADSTLTPDQAFDRQWAASLLDESYGVLEAEFRNAGQMDRFQELRRYLSEEPEDGEYDKVAERLGLSVKSVSSAVARLRSRFRVVVRRTVLMTVGDPDDVDHEFRDLFR